MVTEIFSTLQLGNVIHLVASKNRHDTATQFRDSFDTNLPISFNGIEVCLALPKFKRLILLEFRR